MLRMTAVVFIVIAVVAISGVPALAFGYSSQNPNELRITGRVVSIDYNFGDFILRDGKRIYTVLSQDVKVQMSGGRFGTLDDLKEGSFIRVFANQLTHRVLVANTIIVLDDTGNYHDHEVDRFYVDQSLDLLVWVIKVDYDSHEIIVRLSNGETYLVVVQDTTCFFGSSEGITLRNITRSHIIRLKGRVSDDGILAERLELLGTPDTLNENIFLNMPHRQDTMEGTLVKRSDNSISLVTPFGLREARLTDEGTSSIEVSSSKLEEGDTVRIKGAWTNKGFVVNQLQVIMTKEQMKKIQDAKKKREEAREEEKNSSKSSQE